jgi:MSHA biogenesis protein MshG
MSVEFAYKARDYNGAEIIGVMEGESKDSIVEYLAAKELIPISIKEKGLGGSGGWLQFFAKKVPLTEMILFTRKLSTLYKAGIPLTHVLKIIADQDNSTISQIADRIRSNVEKGDSLSEALSHYPNTFSSVYINSIKTAENAGRLDIVLEKISDALERDYETREQIKTAVRYPAMVVLLVVAAFLTLITLVVPKFAQFYSSYGATLPLPTRILINANTLISEYWYMLVIGLAGVIIIFAALFRFRQFKYLLDGFLFKLPIFGPLLNNIYIARFSHLLEVFFGSGAPLLAGLDTIKTAIGNRVIEAEVGVIRKQIQEGSELSGARDKLPHFSNLVLSMMQVGLESGALEPMLRQVASFLDREVDYVSKRLTTMIEPILIIFLGGMVLFLALAIFLPMWNMIEVFRPQ